MNNSFPIRDAVSSDLEQVVRLNESEIPRVTSIEVAALGTLAKQATQDTEEGTKTVSLLLKDLT